MREVGKKRGTRHMRMPIHLETDGAFIDYIDFEPYGTIRVCGWSEHAHLPNCEVETLEGTLRPAVTYRYPREDVCAALGTTNLFVGLSIEFRTQGNNVRRVVFGSRTVPVTEGIAALMNSERPSYAALLDDDRVWHREELRRKELWKINLLPAGWRDSSWRFASPIPAATHGLAWHDRERRIAFPPLGDSLRADPLPKDRRCADRPARDELWRRRRRTPGYSATSTD